jgi:uncharacterized protein
MWRKSQGAMCDKIRIRDCRFGKGVFATSTIREGEEILRFTGPLIDFQKADAKGARQCDPLQIGLELYMDIEPPGVFVNHSCAPNAGIRDDVRMIAITRISAGEEIFYDYSTTMNENHWTLACLCGSGQCRGKIGDFKDLPCRIRHRYLRIGIVQSFLARQYYCPLRKRAEGLKEEEEKSSGAPERETKGAGVFAARRREPLRSL